MPMGPVGQCRYQCAPCTAERSGDRPYQPQCRVAQLAVRGARRGEVHNDGRARTEVIERDQRRAWSERLFLECDYEKRQELDNTVAGGILTIGAVATNPALDTEIRFPRQRGGGGCGAAIPIPYTSFTRT